MNGRFPCRLVLSSLVCAGLILVGCSPANSAVEVTITPLSPSAAPVHPSRTPIPSATVTALPSATLPPTIKATQTLTPSPTPGEVGIYPVDGVDKEIGLHDFRAVVSYPDQTAGLANAPVTMAVNYLFYLPDSYGKDPAKKWPLMLYLHGSGSRGSDLSLVRAGGFPQPLDKTTEFPFIVVSPQCPGDQWTWSSQIDAINALLDQIQAHYAVDPKRITLTGFSMGGFGAWEYALRYPHRFAAVVPIAGGYLYNSTAIPANLCDLKDLPLWVFHGGKDTTVMIDQATTLVNALKACHGNVRYTIFADANHNQTAQQAYYFTPELYTWLAAQKRP